MNSCDSYRSVLFADHHIACGNDRIRPLAGSFKGSSGNHSFSLAIQTAWSVLIRRGSRILRSKGSSFNIQLCLIPDCRSSIGIYVRIGSTFNRHNARAQVLYPSGADPSTSGAVLQQQRSVIFDRIFMSIRLFQSCLDRMASQVNGQIFALFHCNCPHIGNIIYQNNLITGICRIHRILQGLKFRSIDLRHCI